MKTKKSAVVLHWGVLLMLLPMFTTVGGFWLFNIEDEGTTTVKVTVLHIQISNLQVAINELNLGMPAIYLPMEQIENAAGTDFLRGAFGVDAEMNGSDYRIAPGLRGGAYEKYNVTDGYPMYIDAAGEPCFEDTSETACPLGFTASFFIKSLDDDLDANLLYFGSGLDGKHHLSVTILGSAGVFTIEVLTEEGPLFISLPFLVEIEEWYHIVVTFTGLHSDIATVYVNGSLVETAHYYYYDYDYDSDNDSDCGCGHDPSNTRFAMCMVDEVIYWYEVLPRDTIENFYHFIASGLGVNCTSDRDCPATNSECISALGYCYCSPGYEYDQRLGICRLVGLEGDSCSTDADCNIYDAKMICNGNCSCTTGYIYNRLSHLCVDIDECSDNTTCNHANVSCVNTIGSYQCTCDSAGYTWNATSMDCQDVNECMTRNGGCSQTCENTVGSFKCLCSEGFVLSQDGAVCLDVNECETDNGNCTEICINSYGSYLCSCPSGLRLASDGISCGDAVSTVGENCLSTADCLLHDDNSVCNETTAVCECVHGYQYNTDESLCVEDGAYGANCSDDSFCHVNPHLYCKATTGKCHCKEGYYHFAGVCLLVVIHGTDCTNDTDCQIHDQNMQCEAGSSTCACAAGYEYDRRFLACLEIDECASDATNHCNDGNGVCFNTPGSYYCACVDDGFVWNTTRCEDIDECAESNGGCSHTCENTNGSFACLCPEGYNLGYDGKNCEDINECNDPTTCMQTSANHLCHNTDGSFTCGCTTGYFWNNGSCENTNECSIKNGGCQHVCEDTDGSFNCSCRTGYVLNADQKTCRDVDECADNNGGCAQRCLNSPGSRYCTCIAGYALANDGTTCNVADDGGGGGGCALLNGGCQHVCAEGNGFLNCSCLEGYVLNADQRSCRDYDECADNNGGCEHRCLNSPGSRYCSCRTGYLLDADGASCYLDGGVGVPVTIRFNGLFNSWMADFYDAKSETLTRTVEQKLHALLRNKLRNNNAMVYQRLYISRYENGSVVTHADLIFDEQLTDFQVSYVVWQLSELLDGVTVTTDDVTLTVPDTATDRVQSVRNRTNSAVAVVSVNNSCSVVDFENLCGEGQKCKERENDIPYCVCSEDNCTEVDPGVTDSSPGGGDSSGDGMSSELVLMIVLLSTVPLILLGAVMGFVLFNKRRSRPVRRHNSQPPMRGYHHNRYPWRI